ncbi:hypothetical protein E2320_015249, partial [Naja naja]
TMAMQEHLRIKERHHCSITALGYHSARREYGVIKWWDMESGHMTLCSKEHAGWVTYFLSWIQARLLFSASNDSSVLVWAPGGTVLDRILLGYPIFTLAISLTRHLLLCGSKGRLTVFPLDEKRESGHTVNLTQSFSEWTHKDIVSCITCLDNYIYTAGYDKKLLIFDTYQTLGRKGLTKKQCISRAHNAAITHLILVRQQETTRLLSGSFDQTVGIWSQDGKLIQRLGPFISNITGLCYVAPIGVIWITSGTSQPTLYEPQSGEIVSQFISTFQGDQKDELILQQLLSLPDSRHVIGLAKPQQVVIWRYSELGCLTLLPCKHSLECLAYAKKEPVLLFVGDSNGMLQKWERSYRSPFIYRVIFVEQLDILVMSATNGNIYLWEFETFILGAEPIVQQNMSALDQDSKTLGKDCAQDEMVCDPSSSCISDLICRIALCGHTGMITALALVTNENGIHAPHLLSGGWDGRLCLWNLQKRSFQNAFSNLPGDNGPILDVSKDGGCCVRNMKAPRGITCICIDQINGCIMAGEHDTIRIYDPNSGALVQSYTGHQDSIKGLIHVPEMKQEAPKESLVKGGAEKRIEAQNCSEGPDVPGSVEIPSTTITLPAQPNGRHIPPPALPSRKPPPSALGRTAVLAEQDPSVDPLQPLPCKERRATCTSKAFNYLTRN